MPGPQTPAPAVNVAPQNSVWFKFGWHDGAAWPQSCYFYFSTRFAPIGGLDQTDFKSCIQVFTGTALNNLVECKYIYNQSAGNGGGAENGATVGCFIGYPTQYYIRVDGRGGATGNILLSWGIDPLQFVDGSFNTTPLVTTTLFTPPAGAVFVKSLQLGDIVTTDGVAKIFNFGTAIPAGNYTVCYVRGAWFPFGIYVPASGGAPAYGDCSVGAWDPGLGGSSTPTALELVYNGGSYYWPFISSGHSTGEDTGEYCSTQADAETNNFGQYCSFYHGGGTIQFVFYFYYEGPPLNGSPNPIFFLFKNP